MSDAGPVQVTREALVAQAREVAGLFEEEAAEAERLRRPSDRAIAAVTASDIFPLLVPHRFGGHQLDLDAYVDVGIELAKGDGALAWVSMFYVHHNWIFAQYPESFQKTIFARGPHIPAPASPAPGATATRVEGGYRLSGRWSWASGVMHATWVHAGASLDGDPLANGFFAVPIEEVEVLDVWDMNGMAATGSTDYTMDDVFVPEDRFVPIPDLLNGTAPGATLHAGAPSYRTPTMMLLMLAVAVVGVGMLLRSVDRLRKRMHERELMYGAGGNQAEDVAAQIQLGRIHLESEQTERYLRSIVAELMERRDAGTISREDRARFAAGMSLVVKQCRDLVNRATEACGTRAYANDNPIQRTLRDINVLASHMIFSLDARMEDHGRVLVGADIKSPML